MPTDPNYNPGNLLDRAAEKPGATNDLQLAMCIGTGAPRLSRIRNKALPVSVGIPICLNGITGLAIGNTRELARLPRRMSDCIKFAYDLWRLREAAYEGIEDKRHVCMRKSDWGNFPHVHYGQMCQDGKIRVVSYKPTSPKKRPFPPPLFKGQVKWGDRNRRRAPGP